MWMVVGGLAGAAALAVGAGIAQPKAGAAAPASATSSVAPAGCSDSEAAKKYWLSSTCNPTEQARAEAAIAKIREFYVSVGGVNQTETRMFDALVAGKYLKFYPTEELSNGDLGNYSPVAPYRTLMLNGTWLANLQGRVNSKSPPAEMIADMAGTVFHENIHKDQSFLKYASPYYRETEAWGKTINQMGAWIDLRLKVLDTITDPVKFQAEQKAIDGMFGAWLAKVSGDQFESVNKKEMDSIPFKGPCGVVGRVTGDVNLNVARNAVRACRARVRARVAPNAEGPEALAPESSKRPLDDLVMRFPFFSIEQIREQDMGRVCNDRMMVSTSLIETAGRKELLDPNAYPLVRMMSAVREPGGCRITVNLQRTEPGVTLSCLVKMVEFSREMNRAVAISGDGGKCK
jgi:hypothetical protein